MDTRLRGKINPTTQHLVARMNQGDQSLLARLNIYTMETGDGRDIELCVVEESICWRRVGDSQWKVLVPISDITPVKGVDYFTEEDIESIKSYIGELSIDDILPEDAAPGALLIVSEEGTLTCSELCVTDVVDKTYIHRQTSASNIWSITHNLNKHPAVSIVDSAGNTVIGEVNYLDLNSLEITFTGAFSGKCYLN